MSLSLKGFSVDICGVTEETGLSLDIELVTGLS